MTMSRYRLGRLLGLDSLESNLALIDHLHRQRLNHWYDVLPIGLGEGRHGVELSESYAIVAFEFLNSPDEFSVFAEPKALNWGEIVRRCALMAAAEFVMNVWAMNTSTCQIQGRHPLAGGASRKNRCPPIWKCSCVHDERICRLFILSGRHDMGLGDNISVVSVRTVCSDR